MKNKTPYEEMEKRHKKELKFYSSQEGKELKLCLVAQGYKDRLIHRYTILFGSAWVAIQIINNIQDKIDEK